MGLGSGGKLCVEGKRGGGGTIEDFLSCRNGWGGGRGCKVSAKVFDVSENGGLLLCGAPGTWAKGRRKGRPIN